MSTPLSVRNISQQDFGFGWKGDIFTNQGHIRIFRVMPAFIVMTDNDVTTEIITVKFPHRLTHVEIKQTYTDNTDAPTPMATAVFQRKKWDGLWFDIYDWSGHAESDDHDIFGDGWEYPQGDYRFVLNGEGPHRVWIELFIQELNLPAAGVNRSERY